jgi:hypothetical protein
MLPSRNLHVGVWRFERHYVLLRVFKNAKFVIGDAFQSNHFCIN